MATVKITEYDLAVQVVDRLGEGQVTIAGVRRGPHAAGGNPHCTSKKLKLIARCWISVKIKEHGTGMGRKQARQDRDSDDQGERLGERFDFHSTQVLEHIIG